MGAVAILWIKDDNLFFTCSANIISVTSKNVIHLRGLRRKFFYVCQVFFEKYVKKEQGTYLLYTLLCKNRSANVLTK